MLWFPAGAYIMEQGERATSLYVILSGEAEVVEEGDGGQLRTLARGGAGEFVGELGVAYGHPRSANVIAVDSVTCLVFSFAERSRFEGRGPEAMVGASGLPADNGRTIERATTRIDVGPYVDRKVAATAARCTQYPIDTDMFPHAMLVEMFGVEYFQRVMPEPGF